ncbi:MAG: NAD(P)/FAD-dependent oxidoreductase [Bacteroidales bacterium]|nr:NAD(P)/FAD-dependent oxidoreductase [Bacteroidales bacterium]
MRTIAVDLSPEQYHDPEAMRRRVAGELGVACGDIGEVRVTRRILDCRRRNIVYHTEVAVTMRGETLPDTERMEPVRPVPAGAPRVVVVGAGPAGLFAALRCLRHGLKPVIVERGKPVGERKFDIARLAREEVVDPDSNWCFGEGGAGTYSDGKLYTRSTKRGDVGQVLRVFVAHGADPGIMIDAHAHIGTDRLGPIIAAMRRTVEEAGGEYLFGQRVDGLLVRDGAAVGVTTRGGLRIEGRAVVLATGHSARDVYAMLHGMGIELQAKPFALGVRVEHPQELINRIQYHGADYSRLLPAAAYSLTAQASGHGVYSFCMCPGGVIVPAATAQGEQVVNGMSNSRRNSPWANSGIAVSVTPADVGSDDTMALLDFQRKVERRMCEAAGGGTAAPAMRLTDFMRRRPTSSLRRTGYLGRTIEAPLHELLPPFVADCLREGFRQFDRRMHGFITDEAAILAVESRTSSPLRIPRSPQTLCHVSVAGLYPCGEGAGYAGGIVSSAIDGIRCADAIAAWIGQG